jgi:preprotein translocase subunit SecA
MVTVNDYLAKRDSEWMGPCCTSFMASVDCIDKHEPNSARRRNAYLADITYGTNNEFGFDYLRDNMARNPEELVQRKHHYAIVDEVDSVLVDDARTPSDHIRSRCHKGEKHEFQELKPKVERLVNAQRSLITNMLAEAKKLYARAKRVKPTEKRRRACCAAIADCQKTKRLSSYLVRVRHESSSAENRELLHAGATTSICTSLSDELYFVIEERNNSIELTEKGIDLITSQTDDPNFFILPDMGSEIAEIEKSGLSHQEKLEKKERCCWAITRLKSERVHTINQLLKAYTLFEKDVEYVIMDNKVKIVDEQTGRIMEGRRYSDGLHQAIEAKENVKVEAATQTYATITLQNYFRMYHKLAGMTGTAETEAGELWDIYKLDVVVIPTNRR